MISLGLHMHVCVCVCMHVCMHSCMCVCIPNIVNYEYDLPQIVAMDFCNINNASTGVT